MTYFFITIVVTYLLYIYIIVYILINWIFNIQPHKKSISQNAPISIIIAARNEEKRIFGLLESLKKLNYKVQDFEIIVVDDHSEDDTIDTVTQAGITNLKILKLPDGESGKKNALNLGIQNAKFNLIACTDADCILPEEWLHEISRDFIEFKWNFCVMPVKYFKPSSYFEYFQSMDLLGLMGVTYVANATDSFSMANGANMAFTKEAYQQVGGFANNNQLASGDDMFLISEMKRRFPNTIRTLFNTHVLVETHASRTVFEFVQQRIRWGSKNKYISSLGMHALMVVIWLASFLLFAQAIWWLIIGEDIILHVLIFSSFVKFVIDFIYLKRLSSDFDIKWSMPAYCFSFMINLLYVSFITPLTQVLTRYNWKGRTTQ